MSYIFCGMKFIILLTNSNCGISDAKTVVFLNKMNLEICGSMVNKYILQLAPTVTNVRLNYCYLKIIICICLVIKIHNFHREGQSGSYKTWPLNQLFINFVKMVISSLKYFSVLTCSNLIMKLYNHGACVINLTDIVRRC